MSDTEFGDAGESEAADDDAVDFSQVDQVQAQVDSIDAIEDDAERLAAAEQWAKELES